MRRLFLSFSLVFSVLLTHSQAKIIKDKTGIVAVCDTFMKTFSERKFYDAVQLLKAYSVINVDQVDTLSYTVEQQMRSIGPSYGKILSYDFISEKAIKGYLLKRTYTLKFEHSVLVFNFTLYYNGTEWKVINFDYTHETADLFK